MKIIPEDAVLIPDSAEKVFSGIIYDVYQWSQQLFDGSHTTFEMLKRPDTVAAICVTQQGIIVLEEEQPNAGIRKTFPTGRVEKNEDIIDAVQREVREETGFKFKRWRLIKIFQPHTKLEWFVYYWIAWDELDRNEPTPDKGEKIKMKCLDFEHAKELVMGKVGYLGEARDIFEKVKDIDELLKLPECSGIAVDR